MCTQPSSQSSLTGPQQNGTHSLQATQAKSGVKFSSPCASKSACFSIGTTQKIRGREAHQPQAQRRWLKYDLRAGLLSASNKGSKHTSALHSRDSVSLASRYTLAGAGTPCHARHHGVSQAVYRHWGVGCVAPSRNCVCQGFGHGIAWYEAVNMGGRQYHLLM